MIFCDTGGEVLKNCWIKLILLHSTAWIIGAWQRIVVFFRELVISLLYKRKVENMIYHFNSEATPPEMFLGKDVLKTCSNFTEEYPCQSVISIKLQSNFIEIALWHVCSPVTLQHIFRTPFPMNNSGRLLLLTFVSYRMFWKYIQIMYTNSSSDWENLIRQKKIPPQNLGVSLLEWRYGSQEKQQPPKKLLRYIA